MSQFPKPNSIISINDLPDEMLLLILSLLPMNDLETVSRLSRKLRSFCKSLILNSSSLDFDCSNITRETSIDDQENFFNWMKFVMKVHQRPTIERFRACISVENHVHGDDIYDWIEYALRKRAKSLELEFKFDGHYIHMDNLYDYEFESLKTLRLSSLRVDGETVEFFLWRSMCLEELIIDDSSTLSELRIYGFCELKLKSLVIRNCRNLQKLVISSAENLSYFYYDGPMIEMSFENVPCLMEAAFHGEYALYLMKTKMSGINHLISQLKVLSLGF